MTEKELRRWSLEMAIQMVPNGTLKDLTILAKQLEDYVKSGSKGKSK